MNLNYEIRKPSPNYVPYNPKSHNSLKVPRNSMIMGHIGGIDQKPSIDERFSLGCGCYCECDGSNDFKAARETSRVLAYLGAWFAVVCE